jgi:hypothetical protein
MVNAMNKRAYSVGLGLSVALFGAGCGDAIDDYAPSIDGDKPTIAEYEGALTSTSVYAEGLASGWANWSWSTSVNTQASSPVQSGSKSLAATFTAGWAGLYLHSDTLLSGSSYDTVRFWIHGGATGGQSISVRLRDSANQNGPYVNISPAANQWTQVDIR